MAEILAGGAAAPLRHGDVNAAELPFRALDLLVAGAAVLFMLPLMALVAIAVVLASPGPAFFAHRRIGRGGREFACLKFRTMVVDSEARLQALLASDEVARREWETFHKLTDDPRITPVGRFLRASSLDELPQLINVLRGEMSLVGPRPIVRGEAARYGRYFADYCKVRPGVTGLWQVAGRARVSYRRRVAMDLLYLRNRSVWFNVKLVGATIPAVLRREGAH